MSNLNYIFANAEINNDAVIKLMDGKLNVYKRPKSSQWQCRVKLANGKWHSATTNTSDIRLKENVEPLNNSLEKLLQLSGVTYNWIGQEEKRIGFIAQDVEKIIPELVFTNNNTEEKIKGIHQDNLTAILVEAIKEQQKIIEGLKVRISNLES